MIVCHCNAVSDTRVRELLAAGAADEDDIGRACGAGTDCGSCVFSLRRLCNEARENPESLVSVAAGH